MNRGLAACACSWSVVPQGVPLNFAPVFLILERKIHAWSAKIAWETYHCLERQSKLLGVPKRFEGAA